MIKISSCNDFCIRIHHQAIIQVTSNLHYLYRVGFIYHVIDELGYDVIGNCEIFYAFLSYSENINWITHTNKVLKYTDWFLHECSYADYSPIEYDVFMMYLVYIGYNAPGVFVSTFCYLSPGFASATCSLCLIISSP